MAKVLVITPVKDSVATTLETAMAISTSSVTLDYKIYNDFSEEATRKTLEENSPFIGYKLINLEDITDGSKGSTGKKPSVTDYRVRCSH